MIARLKQRVKNLFKRLKLPPEVMYMRNYINYDSIDKSPRTYDALIKCMNKGFDVLDKLGVKYSLGRGLILGFHRDGKFLPNDIDIDIDIFGDKQVYEIIKNMPFEMLLLSSCNGRYMQLAFLDRETNVIFDILFYYTEGNRVVNRNVYGYFWMPVEKIKNMSAITINNKSYPSLDPEWFCNFWYGEDWKKPQKYNADWTIDYRRNCKGFIYKGIDNVVFR